jgi:hydrogenase maturation protein HypF
VTFQENNGPVHRLSITIRGAVQGVGFRPFVYRLAREMKLRGWVSNSAQGVFIEAEGAKDILDRFLLRLEKETPPHAFIQSLEFSFLDPVGFTTFEIRESDSSGPVGALVLPDIAACPECRKEIFDPSNRRYLYPFTNCTHCGPRFSIIEALPYDRANTSMKKFEMCPECRTEYENPADRRFHAQPNACPACGPTLELWNDEGEILANRSDALHLAAVAIRNGKIVALKGLGGFHLIVDARNDEAVRRLRERKHREEKPFALMFPSIESVGEKCIAGELEERLLLSPESPIVLLKRKLTVNSSQLRDPNESRKHQGLDTRNPELSSSIAPGNPYLGVMLPYTPLHYILLKDLGFPVVATSGNLSDEPICTDELEALRRLHGIADVFLIHNRPIVRHIDDSIVRITMGRELVLRRARGYAPLPISVGVQHTEYQLLAVGAHLKNAIAVKSGNNVFLSQHIGDLETQESLDAFRTVISDFQKLYEIRPSHIACDQHPDYLSSKYARTEGKEVIEIQHHYAHIAACMAENQIDGDALGVSWDGTGYGPDGTIWGGEFLLMTETSFDRIATFRPFRLPGGDKAVKEPRRTALGVLYQMFGEAAFEHFDLPAIQAFAPSELDLIRQILAKRVNSPLTSSAGRLFDAVASLVGVRQIVHYEGQAAMELEFLTAGVTADEVERIGKYEFRMEEAPESETAGRKSPAMVEWAPLIREIIEESKRQISLSRISVKFHTTLAEIIIAVAKRAGRQRVVLSGGCFQNCFLTERTVARLQEEGFQPYWHQRIPPNDGGIALGQIAASLRLLRE